MDGSGFWGLMSHGAVGHHDVYCSVWVAATRDQRDSVLKCMESLGFSPLVFRVKRLIAPRVPFVCRVWAFCHAVGHRDQRQLIRREPATNEALRVNDARAAAAAESLAVHHTESAGSVRGKRRCCEVRGLAE
eukprot:345420-Chlamydomonas_euryale.AAC.1